MHLAQPTGRLWTLGIEPSSTPELLHYQTVSLASSRFAYDVFLNLFIVMTPGYPHAPIKCYQSNVLF